MKIIHLLLSLSFCLLIASCFNPTSFQEKIDEEIEDLQEALWEISSLENIIPGGRVISGGWADQANSQAGMNYAEPLSVSWITDEIYSDSLAKRKAFTEAVNSDSVKFIVLSGDIDLSDGLISDTDKSAYDEFDAEGNRLHGDIVYLIGSNTTLIGINNARLMFGGLRINGESNVIIRNTSFYDAYGSTEKDTSLPEFSTSKASIDGLLIDENSSNIWIDHCTFTDGLSEDLVRNYHHDGSFDIKAGVNITISYCEFTNHDKVMLVGSNDTDYTNPNERRITLHHNYFHHTTQRTPRSRGTQMHIYNNYYDDIGVPENTGYALGPGIGSQYIVENNYFGTHLGPIIKYYDITTSVTEETFSFFFHDGNSPELTAAFCSYDSSVDFMKDFTKHETLTKPWTIPYRYTMVTSSEISGLLTEAGSGKEVTINGTSY